MRDLLTTRALYTLLLVFGSAVLISIVVWALRRYSQRAAASPVWLLFLRVAGIATLFLAFSCQIRDAPWNFTNDHRLAPSVSVLKGYSGYYPPEEGPALCTIYGPVMIALHMPAAVFESPSAQVRFGTAVNILVFFAPLFVLLWATRKWYPSCSAVDLLIAMFALSIVNRTLNSAYGMIHADAPAIGFGVVAAAFAIQAAASGKWRLAAVAGVASALSILSKQNMLPAVPVLALYLLIAGTWRGLLVYAAAFLATASAVLAATFVWLGTWQAVYYNMLYLPSHQLYNRAKLVSAIQLLIEMSFWFVLIAAAGIYMRLTAETKRPWREWLSANPSVLLLITGVALCTTSILGKIKVVGSINTLSPAVYFFLTACLLELSGMPWVAERAANARLKARAAFVPVILFICVAAFLPLSIYRTLNSPTVDTMDTIYQFSKRHPGEVYFPQFPLSTLLAENRLYHFSWGLSDRAEAGRPVSGEYFHKHIPPRAQVAALADWVWDDETFRYLGKQIQRPDLVELKGFRFFEIREQPLSAEEWPLHHDLED